MGIHQKSYGYYCGFDNCQNPQRVSFFFLKVKTHGELRMDLIILYGCGFNIDKFTVGGIHYHPYAPLKCKANCCW